MTTRPPGWITLVPGGPIAADQLPPPRKAELTVSGERDSGTVQASFAGAIPRAALQYTCYVYYGTDFLWRVGADNVTYSNESGDWITNVTFRIGPYRYGKRTHFAGSHYLHDLLVQNLPTLIRGDANFEPTPSVSVPNPFNPADSSETANWLYILAGNDRLIGETDDVLGSLYINMYRTVMAGTQLQFDIAARNLFNEWMVMVLVRPDYLNRLYRNEEAIWLNWDKVDPPDLIYRNLHDKIVPGLTPGLARNYVIPEVEDKLMRWPLQMTRREDEDTMLSFYYEGGNIPGANIRNDPDTGRRLVLKPGEGYYRFGETDSMGRERWDVGTSDPRELTEFNAANPWILYSPNHLPSLTHAHLEHRLVRLKHFFQNRQREVTAVAPESAADLMKLMPGNPVRVESTGADYWITELKVNTPPLTVELKLVYPGDPWDGDLPTGLQRKRKAPTQADANAANMMAPSSTPVVSNFTDFPTNDLP